MKKLLNVNKAPGSLDLGLLIARVGIAALMLTHGLPKMALLFSGQPVMFPPVLGMSAEISLALTVFAEVFCSLLILTGFATRLAVIPLAITMVVAIFVIHISDPFAKQEPALYYLLVYAVLFFTGSGRYSFDYLIQNRKMNTVVAARKTEDPTYAIYQ